MAKHGVRLVKWLVIACVALTALWVAPAGADAPRVVASVAPVHSLVANVMAGVGEPRLLIRGFGSPHAYQLRPSEAADLARAEFVFWIGPDLETVLARPIAALADQAMIVTLADSPDLVQWPARGRGSWDAAIDDHDHDAAHSDVDRRDPHLWLSPANASAMVREIAETLATADAANAASYRANAENTVRRINIMAATIDRQLEPVRDVPYVVLHDAFQYFERSFGLNAVGAISVSPDRPPSARRLHDLREKMSVLGAACAFSEPQMSSALVETVIEGTNVRQDVLDPLGASLPPGPEAYFLMMRGNADALLRCLTTAK
jgi:zinc transport system substrate-binding protein